MKNKVEEGLRFHFDNWITRQGRLKMGWKGGVLVLAIRIILYGNVRVPNLDQDVVGFDICYAKVGVSRTGTALYNRLSKDVLTDGVERN